MDNSHYHEIPDVGSPELDTAPLRPGEWTACEHPERPPDPRIVFHYEECRGCAIAAAAALNLYNPVTQPNLCAQLHEIIAICRGERTR